MAVPPQVPLIKFFSPEREDQGLIEFWSADVASYQPLDVGTPHPNTREFDGFKLAKQQYLPNDHTKVVRIYVKDDTNAGWFGYAVKWLAESSSHPVFIRQTRELRKTYARGATGQPLKKVYQIKVTGAGTGYIPGTEPAVNFSGGSGSGAAGHAIVAPDGTIAELILDESGSGYTSAPSITIEAPPSGTTATGTALIQPATALLTAEEAQEFPPDSEFYAEYFNVIRVYETLPGPTIPYTRFDDNLGPVQGTRQAVLYANQTATLTATGKTTYEARDGSSIVAWKIVEAWTTGAGTEDNPVFPTQRWTEFERDGVKKVITRQLTPIDDIVTDETLSAGQLVRQFSQPFNEFLAFQITETITVIDGALLDQPAFTTSIPNLIPEIFRAQIPTHVESHIEEGTAEETVLATGEFEHTERQLTPLYKEVRSTVLDDIGALPIVLENAETTSEFGGGQLIVTFTLDDTEMTPDEGLLVIPPSEVKNLGNGLYVKTTRTLDDTEWPTLEGTRVDENLRIAIPFEKKVVAAGTSGGVVGNVQTEATPLDKWKTITIASTIPDDLSSLDVTYPTTRNYIFPDVITDAELVNTWASASNDSNESFSYDLALKYKLKSGYRGPCDGQIIETYTTAPDTSSYPVTKFFPEEFLATSTFWYYYASSSNVHTQARVFQFKLPSSLHDEIDLTPDTPDAGTADGLYVPATTPIELPAPGTLITIDRNTERWRFGIWRNQVTQIYVP